MTTKEVRRRFALLLKELHRKFGAGKSTTDFYNDLKHFRQESVSKITNDKQAIKDFMLLELLEMDPDISLDWLFTGYGPIFKSNEKPQRNAPTSVNYGSRVDILENKVDDMDAILKETLRLTRLDLKNRGLLDDE